MNVDLRAIFSGKQKALPIVTEFDFASSEDSIPEITSPISVECEFFNKADVVHLSGKASFNYEAPCDRCATPVKKRFSIPLTHVIVNSLSNLDEGDFIVSENMELDLLDLVRSDIILGLPYLFLCKPDCLGVCSGCGKNLNKEQCTCEKQVDERWAKLADFFE